MKARKASSITVIFIYYLSSNLLRYTFWPPIRGHLLAVRYKGRIIHVLHLMKNVGIDSNFLTAVHLYHNGMSHLKV